MQNAVHNSRKVFLLDKEPRCILATYETEDNATRYEFKTWDQATREGDYIVIPTSTRHNMTVCKVVAVDVEPDLQSSIEMQWVIATISLDAHTQNLAAEVQFIDIANKAQRHQMKRELRESALAGVSGDFGNIHVTQQVEHQEVAD